MDTLTDPARSPIVATPLPSEPTQDSRRHAPPTTSPQHPLWLSALLHLVPGAALATFVVLVTPVLRSRGIDTFAALLLGIGFVVVPLELGYLSVHARRTTGSWSPLRAVNYDAQVSFRRSVRLAVPPALLMVFLTGVSMVALDERLAKALFSWMPNAITEMATVSEDGEAVSAGAAVALLIAFVIFNGVLGPVTEELYFRGHLLPRIDRFGWGAPVLGTLLFALYHFHTPWRYPVIVAGFLPISWLAWRTRSFRGSLAAHLLVNNLFIFLMLLEFLAGRSS